MADLGNQLINQSYQNLLQITSSNAVQKGNGQAVNALAITSSTTSDIAPAITNNTNNRVLTATGGGTINGEAGLTFNGSDLNVIGNITAVNTVDTTNLTVNGYVTTNLTPTDATYNLTLGESSRTWNQVHVGTSDGTKTAFFGEDLLNNPGKIAIRTDNSLTIRGQQGVTIQGTTTIATLLNDTLTNNLSISTPSLTATNLRATNSASIGGNFVPQARLHISGANNNTLLEIDSPAVNNILFVSGSGNVGIGTATPVHNLVVDGNTGVSINAGGATFPNIHRDSTDGGMLLRSWNGSTFTNNVKITPTTEVGIGITSPTARLHVSGASNSNLLRVGSPAQANILFITGSGNIGVGTTTPGVTLDVVGQIRASSTMFNSTTQTNTIQLSSATNLQFLSASVETARYDSNGWGFFNTAPAAKVHISGANADSLFRVSSPTNANILFVTGSGNVGIGTGTPARPVEIVNASAPQLRIRDGVSGGNLDLQSSGAGEVKITYAGGGLIEAAGSALRIAGTTTNGVRLDTDQLARPIDLRPGGTSKLFVSASGVGLGTTDPLSQLHISASSGNEFLRVTSGSQNILNVRSGSVVWFAGTGVAPTSNFDFDIQGTGTANSGTVRIAGAGTTYNLSSAGTITRTSTGNNEMFGMTMGGSSTSVIQNPLKVQFDASQGSTAGYTVLRLNATHTSVGTGNKLLQTWEFGGTQRSVVNITGSIGVGITTPSASVHISSSLGLAPILAITPHHPLPTTNIPTGSFMVSASTPPKPFFWDGTTWNALY